MRVATDSEEARLSAMIAREEAEHAALAFDVVRWVLSQDASLTPNHRQKVEGAIFPSALLGPRRARELAGDYTTTAQRLFLDQAGA